MNRKDIINDVYKKNDFNLTKKQTEILFDLFISSVKQGLVSGEDVKIHHFGSFNIKSYNASEKNVFGKGTLKVPPRKKIKFQAGADLKNSINLL